MLLLRFLYSCLGPQFVPRFSVESSPHADDTPPSFLLLKYYAGFWGTIGGTAASQAEFGPVGAAEPDAVPPAYASCPTSAPLFALP